MPYLTTELKTEGPETLGRNFERAAFKYQDDIAGEKVARLSGQSPNRRESRDCGLDGQPAPSEAPRAVIQEMAHRGRFELPTPRFVVWCSIQLSYRCKPKRAYAETADETQAGFEDFARSHEAGISAEICQPLFGVRDPRVGLRKLGVDGFFERAVFAGQSIKVFIGGNRGT